MGQNSGGGRGSSGGGGGNAYGAAADPLEDSAWIVDRQGRSNEVMRWKRGRQIGHGTFGKVFMGVNEQTGQSFAVKQIPLCGDNAAEAATLQAEIDTMRRLDHPHIVRYIHTDRGQHHLYILMEFVSNGSIHSWLKQYGVLDDRLIRRLMHQILLGVAYLHENRIIHRDIKGANVLITDLGVAKLADFGCSKQLSGCMSSASIDGSLHAIQGSVPWMAPEVIKQTGHGRSADIWSVGATMIEMATASRPWPEFTNNLAAMFHVVTAAKPPPAPERLPALAKDFLAKCMQIVPEERWKASQLLQHEYLSGAAEELEALVSGGVAGVGIGSGGGGAGAGGDSGAGAVADGGGGRGIEAPRR